MESTIDAEIDLLVARLAKVAELEPAAIEAERIAVLGRKQGALTALMKRLPDLAPEARPAFGARVNELKTKFESAFDARAAALGSGNAPLHRIDPTMPGRRRWVGAIHPVVRAIDDIVDIFRGLGFAVAVGPEAETEWLNFFALNFPENHPVLDSHDTLFLSDGSRSTYTEGQGGREEGRVVLRTHTSPVQIRVMQAGPPPYRVVIPGMVYRNDPFDPSHAPAFVQIEGLAVDEGIGLVDLKATLTAFVRRFFSPTTKVRFRPSFFPFTEPSGELDIECQICHGSGCPACKHTGWMEILGCGMVHPNVLTNAGVDAEKYSGWAFGMGPGRVAMNRYGLPDIRLLYGGDMRLLRRWGGTDR
jgi:phenylalanyl-tRNA synthetase alpha chain